MTRSKAIAKHCLDCAGIPKEVTLCHLFDCSLWEFRFGNSLKSKFFRERMERAKVRYPKDISEIVEILKNDSDYVKNIPDKKIKAYVAAFFEINSKKT